MRQRFGERENLAIDTCHGAFGLHLAEAEALPTMALYDLVIVDEISQLSQAHFDRIVRMWHAAT